MPILDHPKPKNSSKVTIRTVAADAGVSVAAVSKVIRNAYGVSDEMREKVNNAIARLGYRPSKPARGLRGSTFTVGVLLVDVENPFLPQVIGGINEELSGSHYQAMIGVGRAEVTLETSLIDSMIDHKMDGLILVAPRLPGEVISHFAAQVPIVAVGYHYAEATAFDTINADDRQGAALAVQALAAEGHRDIGMCTLGLTEGHDVSVVHQREIGYRKAMAELGLQEHARIFPIAVPATEGMQAEREKAIEKLLSRPDRPRAIFCWSDLDAVLVLATAYKLGIKVPDELAVVGFDNSPIAANPMIDLASIDQSGTLLGKTAAQALLTRIAGRSDAIHERLETYLIPRGSLRVVK